MVDSERFVKAEYVQALHLHQFEGLKLVWSEISCDGKGIIYLDILCKCMIMLH